MSALTAISIVRGDWRWDDEDTWLSLAAWRQFLETTPRSPLISVFYA